MSELLFEIGTEEIPAGYIQPALEYFSSTAGKKLQALDLQFGSVTTYGTPRRLTLKIDALQEMQEDQVKKHIGPAKQAGYDNDGNPTQAAIGFARSRGLDVTDLQVVDTPKGQYLMAVEAINGQVTKDLLPELLESLVDNMPFPKSMHWADSTRTFARPIQWLLALFGNEPLQIQVGELRSGTTSRGHRFMAPEDFVLTESSRYLEELEQHSVFADIQRRRDMVVETVKEAVAGKEGLSGAMPVLDESLIDTVTNLVEVPFGICGSFDEKFLQLPDEALVTSMREHQKYFPVEDSSGTLLPYFVAVNNTKVEDIALAASGHERVLRARLEDGLFFFNEDRKRRLDDRLDDLSGIIFQYKLGTMLEKSNRVANVAAYLTQQIDSTLEADAIRAARLAKADLLTEMVGEFPSLQGRMGHEYATIDGEQEAIAVAIHEHYMPVRAGGALPQSILGAIVGIADRVDTLCGCFAIGEKPTGNKDPFGLRRQAIGLISIIKGLDLSLSLQSLIQTALTEYEGVVEIGAGVEKDILDFIGRRFVNEQIASGSSQGVVEAVVSVNHDNLTDCLARIAALTGISGSADFSVLAGSFKRIRNIIKDNRATAVDPTLLSEPAEKELQAVIEAVREKALPMISLKNYEAALQEMLVMKEPVDRFFDDVMVMVDDVEVRQNRLNLLTTLGELLLQVGDISKMHVE